MAMQKPNAPNPEAVFAALRQIDGVDEKLLERPEIGHLPSVLEEGELPGSVAVHGKVVVLFATDNRIVGIHKSKWNWSSSIRKIDSYPYSEIRSITAGKSVWEDPLVLVMADSGEKVRLYADKDQRSAFAQFVGARLSANPVAESLRKLAGVNEEILKRVEVTHLPSVLEEGEATGCVATHSRFMHFATDRRIISMGQSLMSSSVDKVEFYPYTEIQMISAGRGAWEDPLAIMVDGKIIRSEADKDSRFAFAEYVRAKLPSTPVLEALQEELRRLDGVDEKLLKRPEVAHLASLLGEGELPGCISSYGQVAIVVATDTRLIHIHQSKFGHSVQKVAAFPYENIESIIAGRWLFGPGIGVPRYRLKIMFSGKLIYINTDRDGCHALADFATAKLNPRD